MRANDRFHLTYCTNTASGETWQTVWTNLQRPVPGPKQSLSSEQPFGIGLRLANLASRELLVNGRLNDLKARLTAENIYAFTLNSSPYGSFHRQVIKDKVYAPDWSTVGRLLHTRRLARIRAKLLLDGTESHSSNLPHACNPWFFGIPEARALVFQSSTVALTTLVMNLVNLAGLLPVEDWARTLKTLQEEGCALHVPRLGPFSEEPEQLQSVFRGLTEFQERRGGKLALRLLAGIGTGVEVHQINLELYQHAMACLQALDRKPLDLPQQRRRSHAY
jgi:hypothetical protein